MAQEYTDKDNTLLAMAVQSITVDKFKLNAYNPIPRNGLRPGLMTAHNQWSKLESGELSSLGTFGPYAVIHPGSPKTDMESRLTIALLKAKKSILRVSMELDADQAELKMRASVVGASAQFIGFSSLTLRDLHGVGVSETRIPTKPKKPKKHYEHMNKKSRGGKW